MKGKRKIERERGEKERGRDEEEKTIFNNIEREGKRER